MLSFLIVALLMHCFIEVMEIVSTRKIPMENCELVGINHLSYPFESLFLIQGNLLG